MKLQGKPCNIGPKSKVDFIAEKSRRKKVSKKNESIFNQLRPTKSLDVAKPTSKGHKHELLPVKPL